MCSSCQDTGQEADHKAYYASKEEESFLNDIDELDVSKVYAILCCIQYLHRIIKPNSSFKETVHRLIAGDPIMPPVALGFTSNWQEEEIW